MARKILPWGGCWWFDSKHLNWSWENLRRTFGLRHLRTFSMPRFRFSVGLRIYSIIGLSFVGLIGLAVMQASNLAELAQAAAPERVEPPRPGRAGYRSRGVRCGGARSFAGRTRAQDRGGPHFEIALRQRRLFLDQRPWAANDHASGQARAGRSGRRQHQGPDRKAVVRRIRRCGEEQGIRLRRLSMAEARQGRATAEVVLCHGI